LTRWLFALISALTLTSAFAQQFNPQLYGGLRWRMIGPFRGGRTVAATGIPTQPSVFYVGVNNGGVWSTNDYGHTWRPIFDSQPTGSIGALAVAPSDPNVIYVGSGEGLQRPDLSVGDGIYKSTDAGRTWRHLGLRDGQQIPAIIVDPQDPNRVFAAVLGHPYGPNAERGVFRSIDGGETWQKILYKDENTGAMDVAFDPSNSQIVYADLWAARQAPWEITDSFHGPGSGLFKSTDGGATWHQLTAGLPTVEQGLGRIGIGIAPSAPDRIYALVEASPEFGGLYRSDDSGMSWHRVNNESRIWGRGDDFANVRVDPKDKDVVYVANTSTYRSLDAGVTFTAIKGAPGGDDYHTIWINPEHPEIILLASDQGATVTVNGAETWSSWYNQPTAQFYHVITDNRFPYWVYGGQQESGSAGIASRSNYGEITFRDWHPVGIEEYGYVAPDPLHPNLIYGGKVTRFNQDTGEVQEVGPAVLRTPKYRFVRTMPLIFSPVDPHILYLGSQVLFKTTNGGYSWDVISPDLTRQSYPVPPNLGIFTSADPEHGKHRGVIYTIAPSPKDANLIWTGTDDGLIHITRDGGKTWTNVTPPDLTPWSKVSLMDASHFDAETAYAAINRFRLDDLHPCIYRTHDGGKTWRKITRGIPENEVVNAVREDPVRRGLLFAGTERAAYVSFNDGDDWQSLRLNMPATSIRDLVVHDDDLVVGTHGRSFWILDDISPLRELSTQAAESDAWLFRPRLTYRIRRDQNTDTPLPPEEPAGQNPPDGAIIYYSLKSTPKEPITLEILDSAGKLVRRYSSADKPEPIEKDLNVPLYWVRPPRILSAQPGMHRFIWDLRYPPPDALNHEYPISAIYRDTPREPLGVIVLPGQYSVTLTVAGHPYTQPLSVKMDPRVMTPRAELKQQFDLAMKIAALMHQDYTAIQELRAVRSQLKSLRERAPGTLATAIDALDQKAAVLEGSSARSSGRRSGSEEHNLVQLNGELATVFNVIEGPDSPTTTQAVETAADLERALQAQLSRWQELKSRDLAALNAQLRQTNLPAVQVE
jgi:photosystem II stability/assembly factor-like uncharacterized protein